MRSRVGPAGAAVLSAAVPGLGQWLAGRRDRGVAILATAVAAVVVSVWLGETWMWLVLAPFWLLQVADAAAVAARRRTRTAWLVLLGVLPFYVAGWQATEASPQLLVTGYPKVQPLFRALLSPDLVTRASREDTAVRLEVLTPCPEDPPDDAPLDDGAPSISVRPACAPLGAEVTVVGAGLPSGQPAELIWIGPTGERSSLGGATVGADGRVEAQVTVPVESIPQHVRERNPDHPQRQAVEVLVPGPPGPLRPSETLWLVMKAMAVTIALGFIATVFGALLAMPLAMLGARNLMGGTRLGRIVYVLVRTFMNVLRSIEPLILAVVFVVWVGQGAFAGALALTIHSVAALGKLFSESIEDIDEGPVEAIRATGATWLQTVAYAVLPQVVPPFTAFTVYRFDINVRMSTVLGFVGGGGIGMLLLQWISKSRWSEAATAVIVIAIVVMILDFISATARERIVEGRPLVPARYKYLAYAGLVALTVWAWNTARIDPSRLAGDIGKIAPIVTDLLTPRLLVRDQETQSAETSLVIPCALETSGVSVEHDPPPAAEGTPWIGTGQTCADPGEMVAVAGVGLRPETPAKLVWNMPDARRLSAVSADADGAGRLAIEVEVRPLLASKGLEHESATLLQATQAWPVGPPRPSPELRITVNKLIETVLMALMATTVGAILALPLSLLGARNLMPRNALGTTVYYLTRTFMNILRSIEPIILGAVFASWVGYGPSFAGVLAITLVTVANLGKLFSEAVENIDPGPLEAVYATGARRMQVIAFAVVPQIIPPYLSFGIYQWDINVRISTVIGFVGGGGIGFVLREWMNLTAWSAASVAIFGIVIVVSTMDFLSGLVRARLRGGRVSVEERLAVVEMDVPVKGN